MGDAAETDTGISLDALALSELSSPAARALLDTIDGLRELKVGDIVSLPQIIVVGDQSSGKSSVLEAISRVRFPTKGDLCTRFATELVLRRAPVTKISVRIGHPGSASFQKFDRTSFDKDALPEIISQATKKMGILPDGRKQFSRDILHVEISGPDVHPVTLVDLPGFFHAQTADQASEGIEIARELAEQYMKQPKSIILAVVSANYNLSQQIVVEQARMFDPKRERTLGVITKPDLAGTGSKDEEKCLQLIRGEESKHLLKLGWHVLRNRSEKQERLTADERDAEEEEFFREGAWSKIAKENRGIAHLRKKLSEVLLRHIQKTLPGLVEEIDSKLATRRLALEQLGKPRSEPGEQQMYLLEIADRFQRLVRDGMSGNYGDEFFGGLYDDRCVKLRASLKKLAAAFHATLITKGVDREIIEEDEEEDVRLNDGGFDWIRDGGEAPEYLQPTLDLFDRFPDPPKISSTDLCEELEKLAASNQGNEFPGLPNSSLGFQLFRMQIRPWGDIADFYIDQVILETKDFIAELFDHVIGPDEETLEAVSALYVRRFFEDKRGVLKSKLREILHPYASAFAPPLAAEFHSVLSSIKIRREAGRVASLLEEKFPAAFTDRGGRRLSREQIEMTISGAEKVRVREFDTQDVITMAMTHFQVRVDVVAPFFSLGLRLTPDP